MGCGARRTSCGGSCACSPLRWLHGRLPAARRGHGGRAGLARARRRAGLRPGHVVNRASHLQHGDPDLLLRGPYSWGSRSAGRRVGGARRPCPVAARPGPAAARPDRPDRRRPLGALAGPLCGDLLARVGATVVKVESTQRPDGARRGPAEFFDLLNGRKRSVALDFGTRWPPDPAELLRRADVVIEAADRVRWHSWTGRTRPGARRRPQVWFHHRSWRAGRAANRVAFGDDAALRAVGRLEERRPAVLRRRHRRSTHRPEGGGCLPARAGRGGRWLLDVSMSAVSSAFSGPAFPFPGAHRGASTCASGRVAGPALGV